MTKRFLLSLFLAFGFIFFVSGVFAVAPSSPTVSVTPTSVSSGGSAVFSWNVPSGTAKIWVTYSKDGAFDYEWNDLGLGTEVSYDTSGLSEEITAFVYACNSANECSSPGVASATISATSSSESETSSGSTTTDSSQTDSSSSDSGTGISEVDKTGVCGSDFDGDGVVANGDYAMFVENYDRVATSLTEKYDLNSDGVISYDDYVIFASHYGKVCVKSSESSSDSSSGESEVEGSSEAIKVPSGVKAEAVDGKARVTWDDVGSSARASTTAISTGSKVRNFFTGLITGFGIFEFLQDSSVANEGVYYNVQRNGVSVGVFARSEVCSSGVCVFEEAIPSGVATLNYKVRVCEDFSGASCGTFSSSAELRVVAGKVATSSEGEGSSQVADVSPEDLGQRPLGNTRADFDGDGCVGFSDYITFAKSYDSKQDIRVGFSDAKLRLAGLTDEEINEIKSGPPYNQRVDMNRDGKIDFSDYILFARDYGKGCDAEPQALGTDVSALQPVKKKVISCEDYDSVEKRNECWTIKAGIYRDDGMCDSIVDSQSVQNEANLRCVCKQKVGLALGADVNSDCSARILSETGVHKVLELQGTYPNNPSTGVSQRFEVLNFDVSDEGIYVRIRSLETDTVFVQHFDLNGNYLGIISGVDFSSLPSKNFRDRSTNVYSIDDRKRFLEIRINGLIHRSLEGKRDSSTMSLGVFPSSGLFGFNGRVFAFDTLGNAGRAVFYDITEPESIRVYSSGFELYRVHGVRTLGDDLYVLSLSRDKNSPVYNPVFSLGIFRTSLDELNLEETI